MSAPPLIMAVYHLTCVMSTKERGKRVNSVHPSMHCSLVRHIAQRAFIAWWPLCVPFVIERISPQHKLLQVVTAPRRGLVPSQPCAPNSPVTTQWGRSPATTEEASNTLLTLA